VTITVVNGYCARLESLIAITRRAKSATASRFRTCGRLYLYDTLLEGLAQDLRTWRRNSDSSSKKSTPLWARDTFPSCGRCPPPISPTSEIVRWGARKGRVETNAVQSPVSPAMGWMRVVAKASARVISGRRAVSRRVRLDFPVPGGPSMK
jgi:hypothetical protein